MRATPWRARTPHRPRQPAARWWLALAALPLGAAAQGSATAAEQARWATGSSWVEWGTPSARLRLGRDATPVARVLSAGRIDSPEGEADNRPADLVERDDRLVQLAASGRTLPWHGRLVALPDARPGGPGVQRLFGFNLALGGPGRSVHLAQQHLLQDGSVHAQRAISVGLAGARVRLGLSLAETSVDHAPPARTAHVVLGWQHGDWHAYASWRRVRCTPAEDTPPRHADPALALQWSPGERGSMHLMVSRRPQATGALHLAFELEHRL